MSIVELKVLTRGEVHSLSGHDRGLAARELFKLSSLDGSADGVTVSAPDDLDALSPSFVQGLFGDSVQALGEDQFFRHYQFKVSEHLRQDIKLGVNRVLMQRRISGK